MAVNPKLFKNKAQKSIDAYPVIKCMRCKDTRFALRIAHSVFRRSRLPIETSFSPHSITKRV